MSRILQRTIQVIFLLMFGFLVFTGKVQIWLGVFVGSVFLSIFFGRFFCGWICPINSVMRVVSWIKAKLKIKGFNPPAFMKKPFIRYIILAAFILSFAFVMYSGKKLPILPGLFAAGVFLTFFFPESFWHKNLCPYGTILSITSKKSKFFVKIDSNKCIDCGVCKKVCPAEAVHKSDKHSIQKNSCIVCLDCSRKCPVNAIHYTSERRKK